MIGLKEDEGFLEDHCNLVEPGLRSIIEYVLAKNGLPPKKVRTLKVLEADLKKYLEELLLGNNLCDLIKTAPKDFETVIKETKPKIKSLLDSKTSTDYLMEYIFIDKVYSPFDKWTFINRLSLSTCIYCNRNYIYHLDKDKQVKPQLDHFYPKDCYPYLGISYYNLIQSCQTCNGFDCKGKLDPLDASYKLVNPYLISADDFRFSYRINSVRYNKGINENDAISIVLDKERDKNATVFKLNELYAKHTDHVAELIYKSKLKYSRHNREYLVRQYKSLGLTEGEITRMILGNYFEANDLHLRPLAKMYSDIGTELGLILKKSK